MKNIVGIILVIAGIALLAYGFNHMNSTGSKVKDFFGMEDTTGITTIIVGAVLAIAGVVAVSKNK